MIKFVDFYLEAKRRRTPSEDIRVEDMSVGVQRIAADEDRQRKLVEKMRERDRLAAEKRLDLIKRQIEKQKFCPRKGE